ncbi:hypothetical protein AB0N17_30815 [Streptomyces sp. NPDC051133]|uniref:hypothetical protein n=1 Tax=Streptomyces sp. NPDC051133 TaxID=3155521 RepID=UPI003426E022
MKKSVLRSGGLAVVAVSCMAFGTWNAAASEGGALSQEPQTAPMSATQCYATRGNPKDVVCYRNSWKAEFRHGDMVYVPILIQVPTPPHATSVTVVESLNDIRPSNSSQ